MIWDFPTRLQEHPLLYDWSADGQKLYGWLRRRVCRGEADSPARRANITRKAS